jgi:hypothetical protein
MEYIQNLKKFGRNKLMKKIFELLRHIWEEERIPEEWKETMIVPIYKKGVETGVRITGERVRKCKLQKFGDYNFR